MKRLTTFLMALMLTWIGANAQIADGSYMIVNTETDQFLYGSYNWGCRASLGSKPVFWTVTLVTDNTYTLSTQQWTDTKYMYLSGTDFYCDGSSTNITVTETENGSGIYTISSGTNYMLQEGKNAGTTTTTDASLASHWQFVSLDDVIASMEDASSSNPVDVTALIDDANFKPGGNNGLSAKNSWTATGVTIGKYESSATTACCAEAYHQSTFSISQSITLPKAGYYNLSAQGFYRDDSSSRTSEITAQMFAGDQTVDLNARQTDASSMAAAWAAFLEGSEPVPSITIYAENDEEVVSIGFSGGDDSAWVIFGELQLEYLGETLEYAIGEPECTTAYVQPGGELTITFPNCVTPNTNEEPVLDSSKSITVNGENVTDAVLTSTGLTSTVTFTVPTTLTQGAEVTVIVPAGLVTWSGTTVSSPAQNVTFTLHTPAIADQMGVYLMNTNTSEYLSRGYNWGTRADVDYYGIPVDIVADEDGLYTIQYVDNSGYLGDTGWAYGDCGTDRWVHYTIETYNESGVTGYRFKCEEASTDGTARYLYLNENNTENDEVNEPLVANNGLLNDNYTEESQAVWQIHDEAAHTAQKAAFVASQKAAIAELVGADDLDTYIESQTATDVTGFVEDPSFASAAINGTSGWIGSYTHTEEGNNGSFSSTSNGFESWNGCIQLQQTITDLPSGVYKIDLKGFFRQATNIICYTYKDYDMSTAFIDANGYEINLKPWASEASINDGATGSVATDYSPNGKDASYTACATGYANELYTYVGEDGTLVITIDNQGYAFDEWMYLREMSLTYYGEIEEIAYDYDVTWELANPSFEADKVVANLTEDATRNSYTVTSLTGWNLAAPTHTNNDFIACDLMTADATATDNNFGVPGEPANGTFMLYLRESHASYSGAGTSASVEQTITLPAGDYKLTVDGKCVASNTGAGTVSLVAGDKSKALDIHVRTSAVATDPFLDAWDTAVLTFSVDEDNTEVTLGVDITFAGDYALSVLLDNFKLYSAQEIEESISWEMTSAGWGTMILPFSATLDENLTAYSCAGTESSTDEDGNEITVVSLEEVGQSITANTPYIIKGTAATYSFTGTPTNTVETYTAGIITGTLVDLAVAKGAAFATDGTMYLLQNHEDEDVAFYPIIAATEDADNSKDATLDAYHCYLTVTTEDTGDGTTPAKLSFGFAGTGEETGIVAVEGAETLANDAIYDLSGRRVSKAVKGVYIQNGKKVLVK